MNDPKAIINPEWEEAGDHYETYYPGHQPNLHAIIKVGPPPYFLTQPNGQLLFPFMIDDIPLFIPLP